MQVFVLISSVMSDHLFPKDNIVLPTNGRAPQLCWGKTIYSWGTSPYMTDDIIFFFFFFLWRWRGGGGFIINIFIFIFFYGGASHITGGGCGGLIFFKRSGLFFIFIFFYGGGRTSLGEGGVGKIKCPRRGPIFFCFFFFCWRRRGGGGKNLGGSGGKSEGEKEAARADNV